MTVFCAADEKLTMTDVIISVKNLEDELWLCTMNKDISYVAAYFEFVCFPRLCLLFLSS